MPRRFVRESKFRHVFGEPFKRDKCYENIDITKNVWDGGYYCAVNSKFIAVVLDRAGGSAFLVLPIEKTGRIDNNAAKFSGHKGKVLDLQFSPFNANILASAGEDSRIKIWTCPDDGITEDVTDCTLDLVGHRKKVGIIQWHPSANNVLASAGFDHDIIVWDVEKATPVQIISCHEDVINSMSWNFDGSLLATSCEDKVARIIDPRATEENVVHSFAAHEGSKPFRIYFVDDNRLMTIGTQTSSTREIALWSTTDLSEAIIRHDLDEGSGNMLTMYDSFLNILYVAVKGDTSIKYFEISKESPYIHYLNQYQAATPQHSFGILPKRALQVNKCEVFRVYKLGSKNLIEPISMVVPRKSDCFQQDIYPNIPGDTSALTVDQWFSGENADPVLISLKDGFAATKKEFSTNVVINAEENIFAVGIAKAPERKEESDCFQQDIYPNIPGDTSALTADQWFSGENADPVLISLKDGFAATKKEFSTNVVTHAEENIFAVGIAKASQREGDLKKSFYQQQDELRELRELLKGKELKIKQLEYENVLLKKKTLANTDDTDDNTTSDGKEVSSMIAEDSDCSLVSSDEQENTPVINEPPANMELIETA